MSARARGLFEAVRHMPPRTWSARLAELCGDPAAIDEVLALLDSHTLVVDPPAPPGEEAPPPDSELETGDRLGVWRLSERLGAGGMGTVFLAERDDLSYRQQVAIKLLRGRPSRVGAERLAAERQILAELQHPNIARLFDGGSTPAGHPYLVMEYVRGLPLDAWCRAHAPALETRLRLFLRVCQAVQAAHQRLVVHCDLKPGNILVREDGEPVLLDFGIARLQGDLDDGAAYGTPAYASPEQLAGRHPGVVGDVFSLGVLLTELSAGRPLCRGLQDRGAPPPPPSALATDPARRRALRGDLDAICARACAIDPAQRYPTVEALHLDLRRHLETRPVLARGRGGTYRWRRYVQRNRWPLAAGAVTATAVLAGLLVSLHALDEARAQQVLVQERSRELERVVAFQRSILEGVDVEAMGGDLLAMLRAQIPPVTGGAEDARLADPLAQIRAPDIARTLLSRGMLEEAERAIQRDFADNPQLSADLGESVAQVQHALGLYDAAAAGFGRAAEARVRLLGADAPAVLRARSGEAGALNMLEDRGGEARRILERALALSTLPDSDPIRLDARIVLGELVFATGEHARAVAMQEAVYRDALRTLGEADEKTLTAMGSYGTLLTRTDELGRAREILESLLARSRERFGPEHPRTLSTMGTLSVLRARMQDTEQALALQQNLLSIQQRRLGAEHPVTLAVHGNLAIFLLELDRDAEALAELERVHAARARVMGPDAPATLRAKLNLATFFARNDQVERALEIEAEVLAARRRLFGLDHPDTLFVVINHAGTRYRAGAHALSLSMLEEALPVARRVLGEQHRQMQIGLLVHGKAALAGGRFDAAEASHRELLALRERDHGRDGVATLQAAWELEQTLRGGDRGGEADLLRQAYLEPFLALPDAGLNRAQQALREELLGDAQRVGRR